MNTQDSCWIQLAKAQIASLDRGRVVRYVDTLSAGWQELVLVSANAMLWSEGEAVGGLSGWTAGLIMGST